ncbi:MAG: hypothetical protein M1837_005068 [Sclerophora amabilis]|nr:MAG: hypothetical protein M1837_005068 [Sclerophora amabilis]
MGEFRLSASLEGHHDDVRGVVYPSSKAVVSASRDATVRLWRLLSSPPPAFEAQVSSQGSSFVNAVTYLPANSNFPEGLIISGGKDTVIEVRQPGKSPDDDAEALLLGHSNNVCALDVDPSGQFIISGGWDGQARLWRVGKWECETVFEEHQGSVWAVLSYDDNNIITGCADQLIRVFSTSGKLLRTIKGNTDVVRALCQLPTNHPSGAQFASASNDGIIRLWTLEGDQAGELHGHESFIYSLACLPSGELVSSGEDRTVKIWKGTECIQTITHPAISVWGVAACSENGDIVSGASDRIVRVFSRSKERQADPEAIKAFEDSVGSSSIPQQQVGDINKEKLPGPEFLQQKSGTKEGQVQMIREGSGNITAHQWSMATQQWVSVGTVVDAAGSSGRKQDYQGKDYDYVFDVDIEDGKPPLKLPYNLSQNPYEAAKAFIDDNELPATYLDQVANFITTNTQGASLGPSQQPQPAGSDPWGTESRYRPGEVPSSAPSSLQTSRPKVLPQTTYLAIKQANLKTVQKKIQELNQQIISEGMKDVSLNPSDLNTLQILISHLEEQPIAGKAKPPPAITNGLELVIRLITLWPPAQRLPGLDLLRLLAAATPAVASYRSPQGNTIIDVLERSGVFTDRERSNNIMLAIRTLANLFEFAEGRALANAEFEKSHSLTRDSVITPTTNRNLTIASTTLSINYAVLFTSTSAKPSSSSSSQAADRALSLLDDLTSLLSTSTDSEVTYRALVAAGTLVSLGEEVQQAAKTIFLLGEKATVAQGKVREPRIKSVVAEIQTLLSSD